MLERLALLPVWPVACAYGCGVAERSPASAVSAPSLDDARRAADALVDAGAGEVWLYGSVARGESRAGSDIDLVAVFDDVEYRRRVRTTLDLQRLAEAACGRRVEVMLTDRPEWRIQREQVSASFVSAILCDLKLLACNTVSGNAVDWDKKQLMATSNDELAVERLDATLLNMFKIEESLLPGAREQQLADSDDPGDYLYVRGARLIVMCEAAHLAVENAAKALAVLSDVKAETLWSHDVSSIVDALDDPDAAAMQALMASAPELVKTPDYITMWRTLGVYGTPTEGKTVYDVATPAFAAAVSLIACGAARYVVGAAPRRIAEHETAAKLRQKASTLFDYLNAYDTGTGQPIRRTGDGR